MSLSVSFMFLCGKRFSFNHKVAQRKTQSYTKDKTKSLLPNYQFNNSIDFRKNYNI